MKDELPAVWGDKSLLTQVYQNLIGNAIKFIKDKQPKIHLTFEEVGGEKVYGVKDNGIGIKAEYLMQIFEPFKRLHSRGEYKGTGIGLSVCRKVIEHHAGRIWVESEPGEGSHFKFVLSEREERDSSESVHDSSSDLASELAASTPSC